MKRKAWRLKAGNIKNLKLTEEELPQLKEQEVRIAVKAIGLNFADISAILGLYSATPKGEFVPGLEYSGVVEAVGKSVAGRKIGDRVMGIIRFGAYATHINIDHRYVVPIPDRWSFEEGASFLVQALTAHYALINLGELKKDDTVVIHSAAGGVGIYANRIAKKIGAYTIGTVGNPAKVDFVRNEGYDEVIVRRKDFAGKLKKTLDGRALNLLLDPIGGKILMDGYEQLAPMGRVVVYGAAHFSTRTDKPNYIKLLWNYYKRPKFDPLQMTQDNKSVMGFNLIWLYEKVEVMYRIIDSLEQLQLAKPYVGKTYRFDEIPDALREFQGGNTIGKQVVLLT